MAVAFYNANTSYTTDVGTDVALERLRNREIVDRFTGESIASSDLPYGSAAASGYRILPGGTTNSTLAPGVYAVIGESIEIPSDTNYIFPVGVHVLHFNCQLIFRQTASRGGTAADGFSPIRSNVNDSRVSEGSATTGGVHYYGCSFTVYSTVPANDGFKVNDFMNSTYNGGAQTNRNRAPFAQGARVINGSFLGAGSISFGTTLEFHEAPEIIEGVVLDNCSYEMENLQGIFQVTHPDFTNTGSDQRFRFQPLTGGNVGGIQTIGHFTTADNTTATNITYGGVGSTQYAFFNRASANNIGGVWSYYSWEPSFFEDLARTIPIEGVRVRVASNAGLASTTDNSTIANFFTRLSTESTTDIDLTAAARNSINQYITDGTGFVVADANTSYSVDGTTFTTGEWIDWLRHGVIANSLGLYGGASTAQAFNGTNPPNNAVIALVFQLANGALNQYETSIRARSYSHDVIIDEEIQSSRIGTGIGEQDASVGIATQERPVLGPSLVGTVVKDANVTSTNTPSLSFPADNAVSINDIRDARRAEWYEYAFGTETTDPLTQDISFTLDNGLGSDYTSTADAITIRANGIAFGTGDLFNTDTNLVAGNFGGGSLQGHALTFSGAVTNLGGMSTAASITAASIAIANGATITDNSTLTATNAITNIGNVSNSRIDGGSVAFASGTRAFENANIESDGAIALSDDHAYGGSTLTSTLSNAINFTSVPADLSDVTLNGSNTEDTGIANIAGDAISTFTDVTWEGVVDFDDTDANIVHVFVGTTFDSLPTNTEGGGVDFQLGAEDTLMSTFGQTTAPTGFTQIFDPLVLTISNPSTVTFPYTIAYNLTDGDGTVTTGTIAQGVADVVIELDINTFGTDGTTAATLVVTGRGFSDFKEDISYDVNDLAFTPNLALNPLASAGSVTNTLSTTFSGTEFRIQIPAGTTDYSSAGAANTDFLSTKGTINYANYIAATNASMGLGISVNGGIIFYGDGTNIAGIEITAGGLVSPPIQFASFIAAVGQAVPVSLLGGAAAFNSAVVQGLTIYFDAGAAAEGGVTDDSTSLGVVAEPDSSVDYPRISTELTTTIIDTRVATTDDLTDQTTEIVGEGGQSISGIKTDTEAILESQQVIRRT